MPRLSLVSSWKIWLISVCRFLPVVFQIGVTVLFRAWLRNDKNVTYGGWGNIGVVGASFCNVLIHNFLSVIRAHLVVSWHVICDVDPERGYTLGVAVTEKRGQRA